MNVAELERLLGQGQDWDSVEGETARLELASKWEYLTRRVIAAEKLVAPIKDCIAFRFDPNIGIELNRLEEAITTYEDTK